MTASIHIKGNIGQEPEEIKAGSSGALYLKFSVATTERIKNKSTGEYENGDTSWWNCTAFGNTAEMIKENLGKGSPVILDGRVKIRAYEQDGIKKYITEVTVDEIGLDLSRAKRQTQARQERPSFDEPAPF